VLFLISQYSWLDTSTSREAIMYKSILLTTLGAVSLSLQGCEEPQASEFDNLSVLLAELEEKTSSNMVFIEGGSFIMGDFGAVGDDDVWRPYFPATIEEDKPHEVTLSSYYLSNQKTTWADFDTYLLANQLDVIERIYSENRDRTPYSQDPSSRYFIEKPAQVTWQEAKGYCQWMGAQTALPLDLPTSAQWEFAARNRGSKDWLYSTHDGKYLNSNYEMAELVHEGAEFVPVGSRLPPNPLGIYDMLDNGEEWVNDWFSKAYYRESDGVVDPQGPAQGAKKVIRNLGTDSLSFSFSRRGSSESVPSFAAEGERLIMEYTFRCAAQSNSLIQKNTDRKVTGVR